MSDTVEREAIRAVGTTETDRPDRLAAILAANMAAQSGAGGLTKRSRARLAIVAAIRTGDLQPGDLLPPETKLTDILGVSLGTVQAALRQLQAIGAIVRRRGDGSRIASVEPLGRSVWHFRFVSKVNETPLRIAREEVAIETVADQGVWSDHLGRADSYIRVRRRITMHEGTRAGADMYVRYEDARGLLDVDPEELDMVNIRPFLEEQYGLVTAGADHVARTVSLGAADAKRFRLARGIECFDIHAKAYAGDGTPVYFQRILIATAACALTF
ncbi:MAG: GntR family transcriptional regulator [Pseudomonadota bacterium]